VLGRRPLTGTVAAGLLALLPIALATGLGGRGPGVVELHLGPGDAPYVRGFLPSYDVVGRERTHWTTYDAAVELPLTLEGGPVTLSYRYARDFVQTAQVEVRLRGATVDRFSARGGDFETRRVELGAVAPGPVTIGILSDSHERRNMGLKLDRLRLEYGPGATLRLRGVARWQPLLLGLLVFAGLRLLGWSNRRTLLLTAPLALGLAAAVWITPWLAHRFLNGMPLATGIYLLVLLGTGAALRRRGLATAPSWRAVASLAFAAFLLRALLISHPDFYYPDLRTHATLAETLREGGLDFFRSPSTYIEAHDKWVTRAYGRVYAFPYSPAFHLPFAALGLPYDALITWMKLFAAAWSTLPIFLLWGLARRLGLPPWGSLLAVLIPTYTTRLSFAFLPSLFGHAFDLALVCWLAARFKELGETRTWLVGGLFVAMSELAYVSGLLNVGTLLFFVAAIEAGRRSPESWRRARGVVGMTAMGSLLAFVAFYRDFLPMVADVVARMTGGVAGAGSHYEIRSFFEVAWSRTRDFFGAVLPVLTGVGLARAGASGAAGVTLLWAWLLAYLTLLLGRAKAPDLFLHGHEALFVTPFVCLLAGAVLGRWWAAGGRGRWAAGALLAFLAVQGLALQWQAVAAQLLP